MNSLAILNKQLLKPASAPIVPVAICLSCALTKATGQFVRLYTIRSPKIGYLWKTIAVVEIREQAKAQEY